MVEDPNSPDGCKFEWPANMSKDALLLDDFSGRLRSMVLTEVNEHVTAAAAAPSKKSTKGAPSIREIYSAGGSVADEMPIARPSDLKRAIFEAFEMSFRKRGVSTLAVIFDHLNKTPKIKRILQADTAHRPVVWPSDPNERDRIFSGDHPFRNSIHEYIVCPESKILLWEYLATGLLDEFAKEYLPECCELIVWSGIYRDAEMLTPFRVAKNIDGVITGPEPLIPSEEIPRFMCAEADLTIVYLVKRFLGRRNIVISSKDNDFIPALLCIYSQAIDEDRSRIGEITSHGLYLSRKVKMTTKIPRASIPEEVFEKYVQKKTGCKPLAVPRASIPTPPAVTPLPNVEMESPVQPTNDDGEDDALDFLKSPEEEKKKSGPSILDFRKRLSPDTNRSQDPSPKTRKANKEEEEVDCIEISERVPEVIDMGHVFSVIWNVFGAAHSWCKGNCDPTDAFGSICFMSGSDYYQKLYGLGWTSLCAAYLDPTLNKKIGCLCPRDAPKGDRARMYRLDYSAFCRLVALAYCQKLDSKVAIDRSNVSAVRVFLRNRYEANKAKAKPKKPSPDGEEKASRSRAPYAPPDRIEAYAARLSWVMNYYTRSHQPNWVFTSGTETTPKGESLFGYAEDKDCKKKFAFAENATQGVRVRLADVY